MSCIVFETPGLIDLRAFTLMGVSAKPKSSNPIGYFGTGLKYAVATLVRLGAEPVVWIGQDRYQFFKRTDSFREVEFEQLSMRKMKPGWFKAEIVDLPYAVSYGRNWTAAMAFRELEANTRDEDGITYQVDEDPGACFAGQTRIVVDLPAFTEAFESRDDLFLPGAVREGAGIQILPGEVEALYWRGLRVFETQKPCLQTYNFLDHMTLTEDRTLYAEFLARNALSDWLLKSNDEHFIEQVLTADDGYWEHGLEFDPNVAPSAAFHRVMLRHPKNMNKNVFGYYARYDDRVTLQTFNTFAVHPLPWRIVGTAVVDARDVPVFDAPYRYEGKWELLAQSILNAVNPRAPVQADEERDEPLGYEPAGAEAQFIERAAAN